jgi:iron complex outermembrane receptor protein
MTLNANAFRVLTAALLASVAIMPMAAHAAEAAPATAAPDATTGGLEQIVVTAQRRSENAQDVPISINLVSAKTLEATGYQSLTDLQYVVPGVQYDPTQGSAFQIRGVGSTSFDFSNEKSVNVVVDDVVMDAQRDNGLTGLEDIQRVEVLYGPQGTLFGKNSTSGVISITTNNPAISETSAKLYASYGERNDRTLNATVNVPLGDNAAFRISGFDQGQDGKGRYVTLNRNLGRVDEYGARAKLLFKPSSDLEIVLAGDYERHYDTSIRTPVGGPVGTSFSPNALVLSTLAAAGVTPGPENVDTATSQLGGIKTVNASGSLHIKWNVGRDMITSITAYRGTQYVNATPGDIVPANIYSFLTYNVGDLNTRKFSEELHLASPTGGFVEYFAGLFYNKLSADQTQLQWGEVGSGPFINTGLNPTINLFTTTGAKDPVTGAVLGNTVNFNSHNETYAAFGQLKFNFTPFLSLALGGRYSHDKNDQTISYFNYDPLPITGVANTFTPTGAAPTADFRQGSVSGNKFTYRIAPEIKLSKDVLLYASYSTGYKPAGIAFVGNKYDPYGAETVEAFEIGEKAEFFDHRVRLNLTAYLSNFKNFQATILTPVSTGIGGFILASAIGNAPGLRSQGIEGTLAVKVTPQFTLNGSATYNEAWFTNYVASPTSNYTNTSLTNAPQFTAFLGADYENEISADYAVKLHADYAYRSHIQTVTGALLGSLTAPAVTNADGTKTPNSSYAFVPGYSLVNMRASVKSTHRNLEAGVYVRNLFNQYFSTGWQIYGALGLLHYTTPNAYRTVGGFVKFGF